MQNSFLILLLSLTLLSCNAQNDAASKLIYKIQMPRNERQNSPLLILMHGFGSNEEDLFEYAQYMPEDYMVISVRAPYTISEGSYKWYDVDFSTGKLIYDVAVAEKSRLLLLDFIDVLKKKHQFDAKSIYLGGFSQGAIMSFSVGLTRPDKVKGVLALSGRVLDEIKGKIDEKRDFSTFKALVIHGKEDKVLPIEYARQSKTLLDSLKINTAYHEMPYAHTTSEETVRLMIDFLNN